MRGDGQFSHQRWSHLICVLAKPTLLFMQIILCNYNQLYNRHASNIELVEVICLNHYMTLSMITCTQLGSLQLHQNMPSQHCYVFYPQYL